MNSHPLRTFIVLVFVLVSATLLAIAQDAVPTSISITPVNIQLANKKTQQFTASVRDQFVNPIPNLAIKWSMDPPDFGTLTKTGLYTTPDIGYCEVTIMAATGDIFTATTIKVGVLPIPPAPTNLKVELQPLRGNTSSVVLSWRYSGQVEYFQIDKSVNGKVFDQEGGFSQEPSRVINGLLLNTKYYFRVKAVNASGESPASAVVEYVTPPGYDGIIVDDADVADAIAKNGKWNVDKGNKSCWGATLSSAPGRATGNPDTCKFTPNIPVDGMYDVYFWLSDISSSKKVSVKVNRKGGANNINIDMSKKEMVWLYIGTFEFVAGKSGYLLVSTANAAGNVFADAVRFVPSRAKAPDVPKNVNITTASASSINITWDAATDVDQYIIESSDDGQKFSPEATNATFVNYFNESLLKPMTKYYYRVRAVNGFGASPDVMVSITTPASPVGIHPRLFFPATEITDLREKIKNEPHLSIYNKLLADAEAGSNMGKADTDNIWGQASNASKCAFLYVLTGEDTWAQKARKWAEKHINDKFWGTKYLGTEAYFYGKNLAQAYDFCYNAPSWDIAFRSLVSTKLLELGDYIVTDGGLNSSDEVVTTMFGIRNAAGGLCYLATDEYYAPIRLDTAYERSSNYLLKNYTADKGARGWNIEGSATNLYAMEHITPFIIAMKRINRKDLTKVSSGTKLTLLTAYLAEIKIGTDKAAYFHPDFNEGNPRLVGEGALGLSFYLVPREYHQGMLYVYDRMVGDKGDKSWDNSRAGSIYSILYHPGLTVLEKEPLKISEWRDAMIEKGGNGYVLFRNSYQGKDDLECQLFFKTRAGVGRSDSMDFRILGKENAWVVGSGGNENERKNTLYLTNPGDVKRVNDNNAEIIGKPVLNRDGSGNVVGFMVNNNVGVRDHKRRFCANFSDAIKAEGAFVISDTSINGTCWQMNTLDCNKIATDGNAFTITAPNGDVMKGTVLYPEKPIITIGSGKRNSAYTFNGNDCQNKTIQIQSINGSYLVVLTVVKKGTESPKVSADGIWYGRIPGGTVTVGDWKVKIDKDEIIQ